VSPAEEAKALQRIAVIGAGAWGTALAVHLARRGFEVPLWARETELVEEMRDRRRNSVFLPGVELPPTVAPTREVEEATAGAEMIVAVVPSQFARGVYRVMPPIDPGVAVILATKGIEERTLALPIDVARDCLGGDRSYGVISGPSFAAEVARGLPTALVAASEDRELARAVQLAFSGANLRVYTNGDVAGVQVAGALKNVIAIAAGILDGLEMGHNTLAALLTRGLAEITRLGLAQGGRSSTFSGLAGIGDLILTCTGGLSRNRSVGRALAQGDALEEIVKRASSVAEGIRTTRSAREVARAAGIDMPIVEEMYRILFEGAPPAEAPSRLMSRPLAAEDEGIDG
jgi:glycerol-3-phosphate dehydrogenase (NAD(P)+)